MASINQTFTAVGATAWITLKRGEKLNYNLTLPASTVVVIEQDAGGGHAMKELQSFSATAADVLDPGHYETIRVRARVTTYTSGNVIVKLSDTNAASKPVTGPGGEQNFEQTDLGPRAIKPLLTSANVGTPSTGVTANEYGDGSYHRTVLTVDTVLPAIAGGANLAVGKLLYTLPAGPAVIRSAYMALAITQTTGNITADTPDGGLGMVIASGVVAVLGGTATFENVITGQTFNDCNGTVEAFAAIADLIIQAADAHTIHFNVADGWAASGDTGAKLTGTVVIDWEYLGAS